MQALQRHEMDKLWDEYWNGLKTEWFKLEILQDYRAEDDSPSLRAWLKGDKETSLNLLKEDDDPEFTADCRQKRAQGISLVRVHVPKQPLSAYMQWEIEYYKHVSIPLRGENVFIIESRYTSGLNLPAGDLMIFDENRAIVNSYDKNGELMSANFYGQNDSELVRFLAIKKQIMGRAEPLQN